MEDIKFGLEAPHRGAKMFFSVKNIGETHKFESLSDIGAGLGPPTFVQKWCFAQKGVGKPTIWVGGFGEKHWGNTQF